MIVIESSAVVDALVGDPVNPELLALVADDELHSASLIDYEVVSALRGHALGGRVSPERLDEAVEDFQSLTIYRHCLTGALREMLDLRDNFTVYDAAYVVLARVLGVPLVTVDTKLTPARRFGVDVRILRPRPSGTPEPGVTAG